MQDEDRFTNHIDWFTALAALAVWFAHFGLVWGTSIIWPGQGLDRVLGVLLTLVAFAALAMLWRRVRPISVRSVPGLGLALAAVAVAYSCVPALIG